jgi:glucosamine--fructose-6-phosphate aminotransferase (isomerizing)
MTGPAPALSRMRQEIAEAPDAVERVAGDTAALAEVAAAIRDARPGFAVIAGRGTSDHAAIYAQYLLETHVGIPSGLAKPSVTTVYDAHVALRGGLVLAISQSGQSPDIVAVIRAAREAGALTVAITNDIGSPLADAAAWRLDCHAGRELAVPATKTYVAELAVVAGLVAAIADSDDLARGLAALPDALRATIDLTDRWLDGPGSATVEDLAATDRALVVSRGYNLATAFELALKLKETAGIFADAYSTADFAHGPRVLARHDVPIVAIRPDGAMGSLVDATLDGVAARGGRVTLIGGPESAARVGALAMPAALPEALTPLQYIVPGQLVVEATARRRGMNPDAPAGLGKVTLTR